MAKKKGTKKGKGKTKSKSMMKSFSLNRVGGIAGGLYSGKFVDTVLDKVSADLDPKIKAVAKIALGEILPEQSFVKNAIKDNDLRMGLGAGLVAKGSDELLKAFNMPGYSGLSDNDELFVVLNGDIPNVNGDIPNVNEDVLGEDVLGDDEPGEEILDEY